MPARAVWTGVIKIAELICPVKMYTAASTSERIGLHMVNRKTGNRLRRIYVDNKTNKPVETADQVKGYETADGSYVTLEADELAAAVPNGDKSLTVDAFVPASGLVPTYFDKPYYLLPASDVTEDSFVLIRDALHNQDSVAVAHAVLFRRLRPVIIRAHGKGLIATTLNFDYEVRAASEAFDGIKKRKIEPEMLELSRHILTTKAGKFEPSKFDDRYEAALTELVRAKIEGRKIIPLRRPEPTKANDLLEALRLSAGGADQKAGTKKARSSKKASTKAA